MRSSPSRTVAALGTRAVALSTAAMCLAVPCTTASDDAAGPKPGAPEAKVWAAPAERGDGAGMDFAPARPGYAWSFPRDHSTHPGYRTEWWYFTGNLTSVDDPRQEFGFQLTFFRIGLLPRPPPLDSPWASANLVMAHAAVSDLTGRRHVFTEVLWREMPYLGGFERFPSSRIAWARAPAGTDAVWTVDRVGETFRISVEDAGRAVAYRLDATPERPVAFQGPGGFSRKSADEGYASLYYSHTRLSTEGTVSLAGRTWKVRGRSWMDREFGSSQLAPDQVGWDWFALQLADGRDLMVYVLRRADGSADYSKATVVGRGGDVRWLSAEEVTISSTRTWGSGETGATYPAGWRIRVPAEALDLEVEPATEDQENRAKLAGGVFYWEGAVRVRHAGRDEVAGQGYVELTGYGERSRPPI